MLDVKYSRLGCVIVVKNAFVQRFQMRQAHLPIKVPKQTNFGGSLQKSQ